jgi:hypothetical protein
MERVLNTGIVIDFEWKNHTIDPLALEVEFVYLSMYETFDEGVVYPIPIIKQGKNLIHTKPHETLSGLQPATTILSDGTTLDTNYRGSLYLWFDNEKSDMTAKELNDTVIPIKVDVIASSCYMSYKVIVE